jgi:hypothetical protein
MRMNVELDKLYKDVNIAAFIKFQRDIHNDWMMQENTWKIYQATSPQKRRQGRPIRLDGSLKVWYLPCDSRANIRRNTAR